MKLHRAIVLGSTISLICGCASKPKPATTRPSVAPATQPAAFLDLAGGRIHPMYRELLAIDLPSVARLAMAQSIDIAEARQRVLASRGRYEASIEALFPIIAPAFTYQHFEGQNQNANGTPVMTNFNNILPAVTVQWITNPGKVFYDIVASKRRMEASEKQEQAAEMETLRLAVTQYYDLVLAQTQVAVAKQAVAEADESLRLTHARVHVGGGLPADELRARASLAGKQQDLLLAVNAFYQGSLALSLTLHMDAAVTLVPSAAQVNQTMLVRDDLPIDNLLAMAVEYRPDLLEARQLLQAAEADKNAVVWGALGPNLQAAYTFGGLKTKVHDQTFGLHEQQRGSASAGFNLGLSAFGQMKSASAELRTAALQVERQLDQVRAQVISAQQTSLTNAALIPVAREQFDSAREAFRLAEANLKTGTLLLLDVLQAQDALDVARLRYASAVTHYNQSQVNLLAALGLLERDKVVPAVPATPATQAATTP
jgi:outer membrane protein TolC